MTELAFPVQISYQASHPLPNIGPNLLSLGWHAIEHAMTLLCDGWRHANGARRRPSAVLRAW